MKMMVENLTSPLFLVLRNLITLLIISAEKSFLLHSHILFKLPNFLLWLLTSVFLVLVHSIAFYLPFSSKVVKRYDHEQPVNSSSSSTAAATGRGGDTAIARAIYQLLSLVNSIPTNSRKYEVICSMVEKLIEDNLNEGSEALRQVNCHVLSEAFGKTLYQLEAALLDQENNPSLGSGGFGLGQVVRAAKGWCRVKEGDGPAVEKLAAELLWLANKMEESGGGEVVMEKWAWARKLGWLGLAAAPRVQASLVKLTAFLIKQAKDMGKGQETEGGNKEKQKQTIMKMLTTWLPLLCRASNGTDAPTLTTCERGEVERALEEIIDMIEEEENQEIILSLWLHHFAQCSSSDWPNLYGSYIRWCKVCRKLLLTAGS